MSHYQEIVAEYLAARRTAFINPEFFLQLDPGEDQVKDRSWWVDILMVDLETETVYLCEVTYAKGLAALRKRLLAWAHHWDELKIALQRDARVPLHWSVVPWVFVPEASLGKLSAMLAHYPREVRRTALERTVPWRYCTWNRIVDEVD